jgi:hypothetical protein
MLLTKKFCYFILYWVVSKDIVDRISWYLHWFKIYFHELSLAAVCNLLCYIKKKATGALKLLYFYSSLCFLWTCRWLLKKTLRVECLGIIFELLNSPWTDHQPAVFSGAVCRSSVWNCGGRWKADRWLPWTCQMMGCGFFLTDPK